MAETHNYSGSREHCVSAAPWMGTYRLRIIKLDGVSPDEDQQRDIPILRHRQARCDTRRFQVTYSKE